MTDAESPRPRRFSWSRWIGLGLLVLGVAATALWLVNGRIGKGIPRVGVLFPGPESASSTMGVLDSFRRGLRDWGYVEGKDLVLDIRWNEGMPDQLGAVTAFAKAPADVIVAGTTASALVAKQATRTVPIVFAVSVDPVADGLVESLAKPGGNLTGVSLMNPELAGKSFSHLRDAVPGLARVAYLLDANSGRLEAEWQIQSAAARAAGLELLPVKVSGPKEFAGALRAAKEGGAQAMLVMQTHMLVTGARALAQLGLEHRLPLMFQAGHREVAQDGALLTYGASVAKSWNRSTYYVHRILQGARPADLAVEQPVRFDLYLNDTTAAALGLVFPASLRLQAEDIVR